MTFWSKNFHYADGITVKVSILLELSCTLRSISLLPSTTLHFLSALLFSLAISGSCRLYEHVIVIIDFRVELGLEAINP